MPRKALYTANIELTGITALLHHKPFGLGEKKVTNASTSYADEWRQTMYTANGRGSHLVVPQVNVMAMLRDAGTNHKLGKTALKKLMSSGVCMPAEYYTIPILMNEKKVTEEMVEANNWLATAVVVVNKARVMRIRAAIPAGWQLRFELEVMNPLISPDVLEDLIDRSGYENGLLDNRPSSPMKPGPHGQFELSKFDVVMTA